MEIHDAVAPNLTQSDAPAAVQPERSLDEDWVGALSRLGRLAMKIHQLAIHIPISDFKQLAFEALGAELQFDSAIWATGVMNPGWMLRSVYAHGQSTEMLDAWRRLHVHDTLLPQTLRYPGVTLRASAKGPDGGSASPPAMQELAHRFGLEYALSTSFVDTSLGLVENFTFYRANPQTRFSEPERLLLQHVLPHLVEAWKTNRLQLLQQATPAAASSDRASGLCDSHGLLHTAGTDFARLMHLEWPDWRGPLIPAEWLDSKKPFVGRRIAASLQPVNDLWLVSLRHRTPLDGLTPREVDIARRYGLGLSYQDIAEELHISPATVRNHLASIYSKLHVSNKIELSKLVK